MDKAYSRINWQNQPNTSTALGATNLNKIDIALSTVDDRVITLDTIKADKTTVNAMVKDFSLNSVNGVITVTYQNGTTTTYDTKLEKLAINFGYDPVTEELVILLDDGTEQRIDLSSLITEYEFENSSTVGFSVVDGKVKAEIPNGGVTPEKLQADYLADITVQAQTATQQASLSKRYAVGGVEEGDSTDNAKYYRDQAKQYRDEAQAIVAIDIATDEIAGIVKGGGNVEIDEDGTMNVNLTAITEDIKKINNIKTATITTTWVGETAPFTQEIIVMGITEDDKPIIDIIATTQTQIDAWNNISSIVTGADKLIVTCFKDAPTVAIPIQIKGV